MSYLQPYRTSDSSKKITTYVFKNTSRYFAFDFGSNDIPIADVKKLDYIFITHEHMDHFLGLCNLEYVEALLDSRCEIYASNVTKDLIIAIFENSIRVEMDERTTKKVRELLHKIKGVYFYQKYQLTQGLYFRLFPSGHTYGSAMVYLNGTEHKMFYTGDFDYAPDDEDRQYKFELDENEEVDYLIVDGTYLDSDKYKDEALNQIRDNIINRGYNNFYCKPEKIAFFSKKLISIPKIGSKYCIVLSSEMKWYLNILRKYNYNPFIVDKIVLESSIYELPEKRTPIYVTYKKNGKYTSVTGLLGLHISFKEMTYFLQRFPSNKTKVLVGHYDVGKKSNIIKTFRTSDDVSDYQVYVLEEGQFEL